MIRFQSRRSAVIAATLAAIVAVLGVVAVAGADSGGDGGARPLVITAEAQNRTLTDSVTVQGTVGRVEQRQVDATAPGRVSAVQAADGATVEAGQTILSLDGRDAIATAGDFPFYRALTVGSQGNDVRQLEQILHDAGYSPGTIDELYTESTRSALATWQAAHGYPGADPESDETFTISLSPGGGYTLGDQSTAGVYIGQSAPASAPAAPTPKAVRTKSTAPLTIQALAADVTEGGST